MPRVQDLIAEMPPSRAAALMLTSREGWTYATVSYTHLRAHETVLDLVCRLLLEKKKKQHLVLAVSTA